MKNVLTKLSTLITKGVHKFIGFFNLRSETFLISYAIVTLLKRFQIFFQRSCTKSDVDMKIQRDNVFPCLH